MALAGHQVTLFAKASVASVVSGDEIDGINSVTWSPSVNLLDITDFKDTTGAKLKMAGLKDGAVQLAGDLELTDAPQTLLRDLAGTSVWISAHFNSGAAAGSRGFTVECKVASFEISGQVDGKVQFTCSLQFTGAMAVDVSGP